MSGPESIKQTGYSSDAEVNKMTEKAIVAIKRAGAEEPDFGEMDVEKLRKKATLAMKADAGNAETRFRPGNRLRTYTGVRNPDGTLKDETYNGESFIKENSTIYRNIDPLRYPADEPDPSIRNFPIMGHYEADGTFVEGIGPDTLYNEYATDAPDHPKKKYGIEPKPREWTEGMAQIPSYLVEIPEGKGDIQVNTAGGKKISVKGGDFIVLDELGEGKVGVQAIERASKERTYNPW
jgi:hypothetical protein